MEMEMEKPRSSSPTGGEGIRAVEQHSGEQQCSAEQQNGDGERAPDEACKDANQADGEQCGNKAIASDGDLKRTSGGVDSQALCIDNKKTQTEASEELTESALFSTTEHHSSAESSDSIRNCLSGISVEKDHLQELRNRDTAIVTPSHEISAAVADTDDLGGNNSQNQNGEITEQNDTEIVLSKDDHEQIDANNNHISGQAVQVKPGSPQESSDHQECKSTTAATSWSCDSRSSTKKKQPWMPFICCRPPK